MLDPFAVPVAKLLVVAGLAGLGAALLGKFKDWFELSAGQRRATGIASALVFAIGLGFTILRPEPEAAAAGTPSAASRMEASLPGSPAVARTAAKPDPGAPADAPVRTGRPINGPGPKGPRLAEGSSLATSFAEVLEFRPNLVHGRGELLVLRARQRLDLSGAAIGDESSAERARLPGGKTLAAGEVLRIYTAAAPDGAAERGVVALGFTKGIWKGRSGGSDRVLIRDRGGQVIVDFSYWVP